MSSASQLSVPFEPEQIEHRAYAIFHARGYADGTDLGDWLEAERQLRAEAELRDRKPPETTPPDPGRGEVDQPERD